jgi:hypothetical protein
VSRKIGVSRARHKPPGEVREDDGAARRTGHVLLLDLPVESACQPPSDVVEVDDAVRVLLEIPGVPAASVQVRVLGNRIEVTGEKIPDFPAGDLLPLPGTDLRKVPAGLRSEGLGEPRRGIGADGERGPRGHDPEDRGTAGSGAPDPGGDRMRGRMEGGTTT